jgi:GT2 family glycosyltransferase
LETLRRVSIPSGLNAEIVVVDNGSSDQTRDVVGKHSEGKIQVKYVSEPTPGLCRARNAGTTASDGELIFFADDDIVPQPDWISHLAAPLVSNRFDGVVGRIQLGEELSRPWLTRQHKVSLAVYEFPEYAPLQLVGANMGFRREVLQKIPQFDAELDAGALGYAGDTLFSWQMTEAGYQLKYVPEATVIHHPDQSRLVRSSWLSSGRKHGSSMAYLLHHWFHEAIPSPRLLYYYFGLKLRLRRMLQPQGLFESEGAAPWEMSYICEMEKCRQFTIERRRPRNYSKRGLCKRTQSPSSSASLS